MNPSVELRAGHLQPLAQVQGARRADALRGDARLSAGGLLHVRAETAGDISTNSPSPARSSANRSTSSRRRPSICWCRRKPSIVIEGFIDTEYLEPEAPFGESHGHVNLQEYNAYMDVTAITHRRKHAIVTSFISQVTPSESSVMQARGMEPLFLNHLRNTLGIKGVKRVVMHEPLTSLCAVIALQFERGMPETEVWRALYGAATLHRAAGKCVIAVNDDIDPDNADALLWAMSYRCQPQHDMKVLERKDPGHGPRGPKRQRRKRIGADQCAAQGAISRRSRCPRRSSWSVRRRSGKSWAFPRSSRNRPGTDMILASGRRICSARRRWPRAASISTSRKN